MQSVENLFKLYGLGVKNTHAEANSAATKPCGDAGLGPNELDHSWMPHTTPLGTPVDHGWETATCVLWKLSQLKSPPL